MREIGAGPRDEVPAYVVLSVEKDGAAEASGHSHVTALTTSDPDGGETRWTLVQVIAAIRDGEKFVLEGQAAEIEPAICPRCPQATLIIEQAETRAGRIY